MEPYYEQIRPGYTHCSFCLRPLDHEPLFNKRNDIEKIFHKEGLVEVVVPSCSHRYHKICIKKNIMEKPILDDMIYCPIEDCRDELGTKASFLNDVSLLTTSTRKKMEAIERPLFVMIVAIGVQLMWNYVEYNKNYQITSF